MQIFNYTTFSTHLEKSTRTLRLNFQDKDHGSLETLFELESLLKWCQARVEIHSILISSEAESFDFGFNPNQLSKFKPDYVEKVFNKIYSLSMEMMNLPQTVIFDLGSNPQTLAFQLSLGADIRMITKQGMAKLSPLNQGLTPCAGILSLSNELFGAAATKSLFFEDAISHETLESLNICKTYYAEKRMSAIYELLSQINAQAPIVRIQTKLAMSQISIQKIQNHQKIEAMSYKAAHLAQDWKNIDESGKSDFTPAQHMVYILKHLKQTQNQTASATK